VVVLGVPATHVDTKLVGQQLVAVMRTMSAPGMAQTEGVLPNAPGRLWLAVFAPYTWYHMVCMCGLLAGGLLFVLWGWLLVAMTPTRTRLKARSHRQWVLGACPGGVEWSSVGYRTDGSDALHWMFYVEQDSSTQIGVLLLFHT